MARECRLVCPVAAGAAVRNSAHKSTETQRASANRQLPCRDDAVRADDRLEAMREWRGEDRACGGSWVAG